MIHQMIQKDNAGMASGGPWSGWRAESFIMCCGVCEEDEVILIVIERDDSRFDGFSTEWFVGQVARPARFFRSSNPNMSMPTSFLSRACSSFHTNSSSRPCKSMPRWKGYQGCLGTNRSTRHNEPVCTLCKTGRYRYRFEDTFGLAFCQ
jgi:hypothetical protein